jgi:hypothetical protein
MLLILLSIFQIVTAAGACYLANRKVVTPQPIDFSFGALLELFDGEDCLTAHNVARRFAGLSVISWDTRLQQSAQRWANQMNAEQRMYHSNWPGIGENLYTGTGSCIRAMAMWMAERVVLYNAGIIQRCTDWLGSIFLIWPLYSSHVSQPEIRGLCYIWKVRGVSL